MKSLKRFLVVIVSILVLVVASRVIGIEIIAPGIFQKMIDYPLGFLVVMLSPLLVFLTGGMLWRTILSIYGYRINPFPLMKYVIGEFGVSFLIPSFGGAGRLTRAVLLSSRGVKLKASLSSVVVDGIIFTFQAIIVMGFWSLLIDLGIINLNPMIIFWIKASFWLTLGGFIFFLLIAKLKWIKNLQLFVKRFTNSEKILKFLDGINEGFCRIFTIPNRILPLLASWMVLWYLGGLIEVLLIANFLGIKLDLQTWFLLQLTVSTLFIVMPNIPLGLVTMDVLIAGVFLSSGLEPLRGYEFVMCWRLINMIYAIIGLVFIVDSGIAKLNGFKEKKELTIINKVSSFYIGGPP